MSDDAEIILELTQRWLDTWRVGPDLPFDVERLRPIFSDEQILVIDDFDDKVAILRSFSEYAATWNLSGFKEWRIRPIAAPEVMLSGDLAVVTFTFIGKGLSKADEPRLAAQHGTHVWRKRSDRWQIVHEHLTTDDASKFNGFI